MFHFNLRLPHMEKGVERRLKAHNVPPYLAKAETNELFTDVAVLWAIKCTRWNGSNPLGNVDNNIVRT